MTGNTVNGLAQITYRFGDQGSDPWLGIDLIRCTVFDEPPMLTRGVIGSRSDGESIWLWVAYRDGIFRERPDWVPEELGHLRVVGVQVYASIVRWQAGSPTVLS